MAEGRLKSVPPCRDDAAEKCQHTRSGPSRRECAAGSDRAGSTGGCAGSGSPSHWSWGGCAAAAAMLAAESSQVETTTAVRVTSSVAAGEVLTAELLEEAEVDVEAVPAEHIGEIEEFAGRTAATALPAGALVHPSQMVGPGLLQGHGAETVAVPVRPSDASMIGLLSPGQHVDVTASSDAPESAGGTQRIAESAPVLWVPQGESENWLGAAEQASRVVILAVDSETASAIAEASHQGRLHLSLVSEPQA